MCIKRYFPQAILAIIMLASSFMLSAANTGTISGVVLDEMTGDPLVGVSVQVIGTKLGAKTDIDGRFVIKGVPPGTYRLSFSAVGFNKIEMTNVEVFSDSLGVYNVTFKAIVIETGKVVIVQGQRKAIEFNVTGTVTRKTANQVQPIPVAAVADIRMPLYGPAHGGSAIVNGEAFDAMFFKNYGVNPFVDTEDDHLSTFAIDVDDASFVMTRSYLERGELPPDEAIRVEEFVNHFDYDYKPPSDKSEPFTIHMEGAPSKFGQNSQLLRIGIKGMEVRPEDRKDANLVFVVDVSGSMGREDRLELVKRALKMLVDELNSRDRVGIVVYGSSAQTILSPTSIAQRQRIIDAINSLQSGGSTNADEGIRFGYSMANQMFERGKINRVILCSDGVANVGQTGPDEILKLIKQYADRGITLSSIGFGMGNYNDILLEKLGNKGNGYYAYVDDIAEARRVFVDNLTGNLQVIARDVKIQVDFNPQIVRSYRLLGYENRDVDDDKFRDDKEDGGEIGAGHEVTALYEIKFHKQTPIFVPDGLDGGGQAIEMVGPVGTVFVRYKDDDDMEVTEISRKIKRDIFRNSFRSTSANFKLAAAAAEFAEIMRNSYWAKGSNLNDVHLLAKEVYNATGRRDVEELLTLITKAEKFQSERAEK